MQIVDIKVDHFFSLVVNIENAYRDECRILELINNFLDQYLAKGDELDRSDREIIQWLMQKCQNIYNDVSQTFSSQHAKFAQHINQLVEKKHELTCANSVDKQSDYEVKNFRIEAQELLDDLKAWANQIIPLNAFEVIFAKNHFLNTQLHADWQKQIEQVNNDICQIHCTLLSGFDSVNKTCTPDECESTYSLTEANNEASEDLCSHIVQCQAETCSEDNLVQQSNTANPNTQEFDLLKEFAKLKEKNEALTQTYLQQNEAIEKIRQLFETKMHEIVDENISNQQLHLKAQKRVDELINENSALKQKLADFENKKTTAIQVNRQELDRNWKLLLNDLSATEPTETELYQNLCEEISEKNKEISELTQQVLRLKQQNVRLRNAWLKTSRQICIEVVTLLNGFRMFSDQIKQCAIITGSDRVEFDNEKLSTNCLRAFVMIRRSVELLKRIYLQNLLGQVQ